MTDENKINLESSLAYENFCEQVSSPVGADLMFVHDALGRLSLEVLWLKLALLSEIIRLSRVRPIKLSQCQINLQPKATHLPRLWNFSVESFPVSGDVPTQGVLHELGLCWFRTLLSNPNQSAVAVDAALTSLLATSAGNSKLLIDSAGRSPALQSAQLFSVSAMPHAKPIPVDLWQRAMQIGLRLATKISNFSYVSQAEDSLDTVLGRILSDTEALRARVAVALFIDPPRIEQDLGELLNELIGDPRWLETLNLGSSPAAVAVSPARPTELAVAPVAQVAPAQDEHNMESTIIIKRGSVPAAPSASKPVVATSPPAREMPPPPPLPAEENLEATIIISKDKKR